MPIDDQRRFSDDEFALILRKATELASPGDPAVALDDGLTLTEIKAAAAQAGIDADLVERAARLVTTETPASPLERVIGGPLRHEVTLHLPVTLSEAHAAQLLSAVRISAGLAGNRDAGHAGPTGMTWHDGGDTESLSVTARTERDGTTIQISLDRRVTFGLGLTFTAVVTFLGLVFAGSTLYPESAALGAAGAIAALAAPLAIVRSYWTSSTKRTRERIGAVLGAIDQSQATHAIEPEERTQLQERTD